MSYPGGYSYPPGNQYQSKPIAPSQPGYPQKQAYPTQQNYAYPPQQYYGYPPQSVPAGYGAPPPYTPYLTQQTTTVTRTTYPGQYPTQTPVPYPQVVAGGSFDPGARFGAGATANVPPPPPGCMPNAAQMASAQGHSTVVTQRKEDWVTGAPGGGYTFW